MGPTVVSWGLWFTLETLYYVPSNLPGLCWELEDAGWELGSPQPALNGGAALGPKAGLLWVGQEHEEDSVREVPKRGEARHAGEERMNHIGVLLTLPGFLFYLSIIFFNGLEIQNSKGTEKKTMKTKFPFLFHPCCFDDKINSHFVQPIQTL